MTHRLAQRYRAHLAVAQGARASAGNPHNQAAGGGGVYSACVGFDPIGGMILPLLGRQGQLTTAPRTTATMCRSKAGLAVPPTLTSAIYGAHARIVCAPHVPSKKGISARKICQRSESLPASVKMSPV